MTTQNNHLSDVLRPTELHDFSDVLAAGKARGGPVKAALVIATVAALIAGARQVTDTTPVPPGPTALLAAR